MNLSFVENLVVKYLEAHPEVVEKLVAELIPALVDQVISAVHNHVAAPKPVA